MLLNFREENFKARDLNKFSNSKLITYFKKYISNKINEFWRENSEKPIYDHVEEDEEGEERPGSLDIAAYQQSQREPVEKPQNRNNVTGFLARPEIKKELENFKNAPLQEKVYFEFLKWVKDNRKYILIMTNQYKKKMCENLGLINEEKEPKYSLLSNEMKYLQKKIRKICQKYGINIQSYLTKNHNQVNHKKNNYLIAKNLLEQIKSKPVAICANELFDFYEKYRNQVSSDVSYKYRYDSQQYCVYLELLDNIEFSYLPKINKSVIDRNYFFSISKREQILILFQLKNALTKFIEVYSIYDEDKLMQKAA